MGRAKTVRGLLVAVGVVLAFAGCSADASSPIATTTSPSTTATSASPFCPAFDGGSCVGPLEAGVTYTTRRFDPAITYSVPEDGWSNFEDLYGNFLLVPPGSDPGGVNQGTSDFIGVYRSVLPTQPGPSSCGDTQYPLGKYAGPTPEDLVKYYQDQAELVVTEPIATAIGGLSGLVVDIEADPDVALTTCRDEMDGSNVEVDWVMSGTVGSDIDLGVARDMTLRLYLLEDEDRVLAIAVVDVLSAPASLASMTDVAESLSFAS
jgi:hypothetical protein